MRELGDYKSQLKKLLNNYKLSSLAGSDQHNIKNELTKSENNFIIFLKDILVILYLVSFFVFKMN